MAIFTERMYSVKERLYTSYIIGADIGGTNTNIGIFGVVEENFFLLRSFHYRSIHITNFSTIFAEVIEYLKKLQISIERICIAAAGVVHDKRDHVKPTNLSVLINIAEIQVTTGIKTIILANDFEVINYGIKHVAKEMLVQVKSGVYEECAHEAILGAGTGLGKCIINQSSVLVSEGGHADFAAQSQRDFDLITFIQKREGGLFPISWEDVLSGSGIERIYQFFLLECLGYCDIQGPRPDEIFAQRHTNQAAQKTVQYYAELYARCARSFALDALAFGGLYIAGGIAAKNLAMFQTDWFLKSFIQNHKQHDILAAIPITVIADYNVSLYGAAEFAMRNGCHGVDLLCCNKR